MGTVAVKRNKSKASASIAMTSPEGSEFDKGQVQSSSTGLVCCHNCSTKTRCRRRDFSEQAWTVLLLWNEINPSAVDQPICSECYEEMRDILIDRTDEIEAAMEQSEEVAKIRERFSHLAS